MTVRSPRLNDRVSRLEKTNGGPWMPPPEAFVRYAGPRDPLAILQAIGLADQVVTVSVFEDDAGPNDPPVLIGGCTTVCGRQGMNEEHRAFSNEAGKNYPVGRAWSIIWYGNGSGAVLDYSARPLWRFIGPMWEGTAHEQS